MHSISEATACTIKSIIISYLWSAAKVTGISTSAFWSGVEGKMQTLHAVEVHGALQQGSSWNAKARLIKNEEKKEYCTVWLDAIPMQILVRN